jgi:UDP-N-acetylmuramoyl-tripeptide--D-alanyl-D-alanine ligase
VHTDSRQLGPGGLFVARRGEHNDGHDYVEAARRAGAVAALVERQVEVDLPQIVVDDSEVAFGLLARCVTEAAGERLTVIAVTGSSGKTSTKDLLGHVLAAHAPTVAAQESFNSEIGVPLTVCRITPQTRYLVVEMGARGIGHLSYLTTVAPPDISVVLNVGHAHASEFGSLEAVQQAKSELVAALAPGGLAVLTGNDPRVAAMASIATGEGASVVWVWDRWPMADPPTLAGQVGRDDLPLSAQPRPQVSAPRHVWAERVELDEQGRASFTLGSDLTQADDDPGATVRAPVRLRLFGAHHVGNALSAAAVALSSGIPVGEVAAALSSAEPASRWRMEVRRRADGVTVVNDAYNANPDSMAAALRALAAMTPTEGGRRWAVLGTMLELGESSDVLHARVGSLVTELGIDRLLVVGHTAHGIAEGASGSPGTRVSVAADADSAFAELAAELRPGDIALFKSSRDSGLRWLGERVAGAAQ